jgi:hypothetical protein
VSIDLLAKLPQNSLEYRQAKGVMHMRMQPKVTKKSKYFKSNMKLTAMLLIF